MSTTKIFVCDKCGKEIIVINNSQISQTSARIDLYPIGTPRTYPSQRIDLCEDCFKNFIDYLER